VGVALGAGLVLTVLAWGSCAKLLWSDVPLHAIFFKALVIPLPRSVTLAIAAADWFKRLVSLLVIGVLALTRVLLVPLCSAALRKGRLLAIKVLAVVVSLGVATGVASTAFVLHAMQIGCAQARSHPRFEQELRQFQVAGYTACSVTHND
jgi:hypothetical protein